MMKLKLVILVYLLWTIPGYSQDFQVERLFLKDNSNLIVYSMKIKNTSADSIIVLHAQEVQYPPFINQYKWDELKGNKPKITIHLGKTSDELNPEKYRATKSLAPQETATIYFSLPSNYDKMSKEVEFWYSLLDKKYLDEFKKAEQTNSTDAARKCKVLKEKHGRAVHRFYSF